MSQHGRALMPLSVTVLLGAMAAWAMGLGDPEFALRLGGAAAAAIVALLLLERMPTGPFAAGADALDAFEALWWREPDSVRAPDPAERERLAGAVRLSMGAAGDAHDRLRPLLRELADARLDSAYGTHLDTDPRAAQRLGPEAWELVRPDRSPPADRLARGTGTTDLDAAVTALERLAVPDEPSRSTADE